MTKQTLNRRLMANLLERTHEELPGLVYAARVTAHGVTVRTSANKLRPLSLYIRNSSHLQFKTLVYIAVTDKILGEGRFAVNYLFLSVVANQRLTLQLFVSETTTVPSLAAPFVGGQRLFAGAS